MRGEPSQVLEIRTNPPHATVIIEPSSGEFDSPVRVSLRRKSPYTIVVSKQGYHRASGPIESSVSSSTWTRNLIWIHPLFWGAGVIVDLSTGAGYELSPGVIDIDLEPLAEETE